MNTERLSNLRTKGSGEMYRKVMLRKEWVTYLYRHSINSQLNNKQKDIFQWATTTTYTKEHLEHIIKNI
jgi:hypothetical protein